MTLTEAARRVGVTSDTLRRWVRRGVELFPTDQARVSIREAARETGLKQALVGAASAPHLQFLRIGEVRLTGFSVSAEVFVARQRAGR